MDDFLQAALDEARRGLDEDLLHKVAPATNGKYYHAEPGRFELEEVLKEINKLEKREIEGERDPL